VRKVTRQSAIGEQGVALIALRVGEMGHLWHPTSGVDSGIDGEIELRDPASGHVRNFRIGVQSKATEGVWRRETDQGFVWRADPEHIEYSVESNQPVVLVCSRPRTSEAYWRNVQEWASDPARRATGLVDFDKTRDRFDPDAAVRFFTLESREGVSTEPPGPEARSERLKTNLLPVIWDAGIVWSVPSPTWLLTRPPNVLDADDPPAPFHLAPLVYVDVPVRPPEAAWKAAPADIREVDDDSDPDTGDNDQGSLFDSEEDVA